jgi:hypothetical protein
MKMEFFPFYVLFFGGVWSVAPRRFKWLERKSQQSRTAMGILTIVEFGWVPVIISGILVLIIWGIMGWIPNLEPA